MTLKLSFLYKIITVVVFFNFIVSCKKNTPKKPNVIVILADDLGYGELGCYGNKNIKTPNLNLLAKNGIKFTDFHSNAPVCTPTRAALMTGMYQQKNNLEDVLFSSGESRKHGLNHSATTLAEAFKDEGYATGVMGKWHLGYNKEFNPTTQGFDEFYGYVSGNIDYKSHYDLTAVYDWYHNKDSIQQEGYVTDLITKNSINFIEKNKDNPFFLFVSHEAPHAPFQDRDDAAYRFPNKEFTYFGPAKNTREKLTKMIEIMDEGIGELMDYIKKLELEENTIVFFLSDNGGERVIGNNSPLNGEKGQMLEGGHRVPAIISWKNNIPSGIVNNETTMSFDVFPTVLSLSNNQIPDVDLDGVDLSSTLLNKEKLAERTLFWRCRGLRAVRKGDMKLLITKTDTTLYNLKSDLSESIDLSSSNKTTKNRLLKKLDDWEKKMETYMQTTK